jgi:hypothetical protein
MAELDVQMLKAEHSRGYLPLVRALHVAVAVADNLHVSVNAAFGTK